MSVAEIEILRVCDAIAESLAACDDIDPGTPGFEAVKILSAGLHQVRESTPLLRSMNPHMAVSGARMYLLRVQRHLLRMVISEEQIDGERACRVLQHLYNEHASEWADMVEAFAVALGVTLTQFPRECTHGCSLKDVETLRRWPPATQEVQL